MKDFNQLLDSLLTNMVSIIDHIFLQWREKQFLSLAEASRIQLSLLLAPGLRPIG